MAMLIRSIAATVTVAAVAGAAVAGPLDDFKPILQRCKTAFESQSLERVFYNERVKAWVKVVSAPSELSYDVRKTDSLVSPFSAFVQIIEVTANSRAETESEAGALKVDIAERSTRFTSRIEYRFQEGKWVTTGGTGKGEFKATTSQPSSRWTKTASPPIGAQSPLALRPSSPTQPAAAGFLLPKWMGYHGPGTPRRANNAHIIRHLSRKAGGITSKYCRTPTARSMSPMPKIR